MTLLPGPGEGATEVTEWSLELREPDQLVPAPRPVPTPRLLRSAHPAPELSRFFYSSVGADWWWVDRAGWTDAQWSAWVDRDEHELWSCWLDGEAVGYFELEEQADGDVEIAYFGLLPSFTGRGIGAWLLTEAASRAWARPRTARVWLHTCTLDSPAALPNYRARGFTPCGERTEWRRITDGG